MKDYGLIIVDKPAGPTSHKVVSLVRRGTKVRKVGHAGTLDPRASGVLVLCLGAATRLSEYLSSSTKAYDAAIRLGVATSTYDSDGEVTRQTVDMPSLKEIESALQPYLGEIDQVPPPFSAVKVGGKKAYEMARAGQDVDLKPRKVVIYRLDVKAYDAPTLFLSVECSAGTYVRSLAHDLGERLSIGAHLAGLRRIKAGPFTLEDAVPLSQLETAILAGKWEHYVRPAADALPEFPVVAIDPEGLELIRNGHSFNAESGSSGMAKAIGPDGELVAILEAAEDGTKWHPRKVFLG